MDAIEYLKYLKALCGDTSPKVWQPEHTGGLFQRFRPQGAGVERVFTPLATGTGYVERLLAVYQATATAGWERDMYFIVRQPSQRSEADLARVGQELLHRLSMLSTTLGDDELNGVLHGIRCVRVVNDTRLDLETDEYTILCETVGDWMVTVSNQQDPVTVLREAYYTVACDPWLATYLKWPAYAAHCPQNVFEPYFALWRSGMEFTLSGDSLLIGVSRARI